MKLQLERISKAFGEKQVLTEVSLAAESGRALGLLGRNGAGKTTTIRILMDVIPADGGAVLLDGKPIDYRRIGIGYLPEERGLYPKKIILEQLVYFAMLKGMGRAEGTKAVDYWLERLGMSEYRSKRLDTLSKGNQQKIQLITALAHNPDIVILDEPFSGLDPVNAMLLKDVVREQIAQGKILLFSSHQMSYIEEFCDSIAILHRGSIVLQGDLHAIKRAYPRNRLSVRCEDPSPLLAAYAGAHSGEEDEVIIPLSDPSEKRRVMTEIADRFDIDAIGVCEPTLGDIFVQYAGNEGEGRA